PAAGHQRRRPGAASVSDQRDGSRAPRRDRSHQLRYATHRRPSVAVQPGSRLRAAVTSAWQRRGPLAYLLSPLALAYGSLMRIRRAAYRSGLLPVMRVAVPVTVVGNLYVGGTGKTPLVIALVRAMKARGLQGGVVARGFVGSRGEAR